MSLLSLAISLSAAPAQAFSLWTDRSAFNDSLNSDATVIDSDGAFAADLTADNGLAHVNRSGYIGSDSYSYRISDVNFTESTTGQLSEDILSFSSLNIEQQVKQDGAVGTGTWGIDSSGGSDSSRNAALFDFTDNPNEAGIGHFGLDLHDFETSSAGTLAKVHLYRGGKLIDSQSFEWGSLDRGNGESHFLGVIAEDESGFFDQIMFVLGDDDPGDFGHRERWAADRMTFGAAYAEVIQDPTPVAEDVPEPSGIAALLSLGACFFRRKQRDGELR